MRSPSVLHVLEAFAGGTERHLLDLIRGIDDFEHIVVAPLSHLGQSADGAVARARALGAKVEVIDMRRTPSPPTNARALGALRTLIRGARPDVIHGHSSVGGALARLASVGSKQPVVYTPHGISHGRWALAAERFLAGRTDCFIALSAGEAAFAMRRRLADPSRISMIPNGIDPEPPPPPSPTLRSRLGIPGNAPLVGSLGRLTWQKAPEVYVAACARVATEAPDAHFLLIGDGPQRRTVLSEVRGAGIGDRFHHLPSFPDGSAAIAELDLFVLTSRFEGCPYSILEAMRAGVPVVATTVDGITDAVVNGGTGLLAPVDDAPAIAAATVGLLRDPRRREAFGAAARMRVAACFDVRWMASSTAATYRRVLESRVAAGLEERAVSQVQAHAA